MNLNKSHLISYARNLEDVLLWRALKHVKNGTYIDFCAADPIVDSISLAFYQKGWRGIHVANSEHLEKLRAARPDEDVISDSAAMEKLCLGEIHWARVDKRTLEHFCILQVRPWIVLFEHPDEKAETAVKDKSYDFVYFDGLNRFYVSRQHPELAAAFSSPPNPLDNFTLSGKSSNGYCSLLNSRIAELEHEVQALFALKAKYAVDLGRLSSRLLERNKKWASRLVENSAFENTTFPEAAHLNPRARKIYGQLRHAMDGKI